MYRAIVLLTHLLSGVCMCTFSLEGYSSSSNTVPTISSIPASTPTMLYMLYSHSIYIRMYRAIAIVITDEGNWRLLKRLEKSIS